MIKTNFGISNSSFGFALSRLYLSLPYKSNTPTALGQIVKKTHPLTYPLLFTRNTELWVICFNGCQIWHQIHIHLKPLRIRQLRIHSKAEWWLVCNHGNHTQVAQSTNTFQKRAANWLQNMFRSYQFSNHIFISSYIEIY